MVLLVALLLSTSLTCILSLSPAPKPVLYKKISETTTTCSIECNSETKELVIIVLEYVKEHNPKYLVDIVKKHPKLSDGTSITEVLSKTEFEWPETGIVRISRNFVKNFSDRFEICSLLCPFETKLISC